jgi:hypothetical protein
MSYFASTADETGIKVYSLIIKVGLAMARLIFIPKILVWNLCSSQTVVTEVFGGLF